MLQLMGRDYGSARRRNKGRDNVQIQSERSRSGKGGGARQSAIATNGFVCVLSLACVSARGVSNGFDVTGGLVAEKGSLLRAFTRCSSSKGVTNGSTACEDLRAWFVASSRVTGVDVSGSIFFKFVAAAAFTGAGAGAGLRDGWNGGGMRC